MTKPISSEPATAPPGVINLADYERLAAPLLDANAWAYVTGGAGDEITMRRNREAFDRITILPRMLRGAAVDTRLELLGRTFAHPLLAAPVAYQRLFHADGELGTAAAAAAQEAGYVLSTLASESLENVAAAAGPRRWMQLYWQHRRADVLDLVRRAEAAAYEAIVLTVDAPIYGQRDRERRASFALPPGVQATNLLKYHAAPVGAEAPVLDHFTAAAPTWTDLDWLATQTRLPLLLKGILHPDDADLAIAHGVAGIIVSNHGGRTLDTLPASIDALPAIAARVAGRVPVLVDSGIRRGTDVFKAIASGASAVLVGRPLIFGLAVAGATGAAHVLKLLRDELETAMVLCGCATLADIVPQHIERR